MQRYGFTWTETGTLKLWQFSALLDNVAREQKERAESERLAARMQRRPGNPGEHRIPI